MKKLAKNLDYTLQLTKEELIALQLAVGLLMERESTHIRWLNALEKVDKVLSKETAKIDENEMNL